MRPSHRPRERDELRELSRLAFRELASAAGGIHGMHGAIAGRAFAAVGPSAAPARALHDTIAAGVYGAVGAGARAVGLVADAALARRRVEAPARLSSSPRGAFALGALNGLIGDSLEREGSVLQQPMGVRLAGRPVATEPAALAAAFPRATEHVVVFLHGLMATEVAWRVGAPDGQTYASRLRRDLNCTAVDVRYNSGLHISENGVSLADLLEQLVESWPVEVDRLALVGHSMGGLVARSACHQGSQRGHAWVDSVRQVVSLGSPHTGAPLPQGVHWASTLLDVFPETRPLAGFLRRRSAGVRDLRRGSLVDEPLLEGASSRFVAATITGSGRHPAGRLLGDWLVLQGSALGRGRSIPFDPEHSMHLGGAHHIALLNHPAVYERLRGWLA